MSERDELNRLRAIKAGRQTSRNLQQAPAITSRPGFGEVFAESGARRLADNFLNIPQGAGNLLAGAAATVNTAAATVPKLFSDEPLNIGDRFSTEFAEQKRLFPASALRAIPTPSANQVVAGSQTVENVLGGLLASEKLNVPNLFETNLNAIEQRQAESARQRPIATGLGEVSGDIASILTGRAPFVRAATRRTAIPKFDAASTRTIDQIMNLKSVKALVRGTGRAVETGTEAAVLAAVQDGSPAESAAFAGGLQLAGSATLQVTKGIFRNPGRVALAAIVAHQIGKSLTPGGADRILPTIEDSFDEISLGLVAGLITGAAGLGRLRGTTAAKLFPESIDALATIPRAATISLVNDILQDGNTLRVLNQFLENPEFFGDDLSSIERAIENDDISLSSTINELIDRGDGFAQKIDAIGSEAAKAISQDSFRTALSADNDGIQFLKPTQIAKTAARVLGQDRVKRLGFEAQDVGPKKFIANAFRDEGAIETMQQRLPLSTFDKLLTSNLDSLISASTERVGNQRTINGKALQQRWDQLPEAARALYERREQIEAFIDAAATRPLSGLSPMVAESLMRGEELPKLLGITKRGTK